MPIKYEGCRQLIGIACLAATMCMFFNLNVLGLLTQVYYIQSYLHVTHTLSTVFLLWMTGLYRKKDQKNKKARKKSKTK